MRADPPFWRRSLLFGAADSDVQTWMICALLMRLSDMADRFPGMA